MQDKNDIEPQDEGSAKGLIAWFAHNHVAANIMMFLCLVGGMVSVFSIRTETFPTIDPKLITVSVAYPGATPYEIADSITSRIEESLIGIDGVKRVTATAVEGAGVVYVELQDFIDGDEVYNDVETEVNGLSDFPPENAEKPIVTKVKALSNVMSLVIYGDASEHTIKYWAETIKDELRILPGVSKADLRGVRDYQISIEVAEETLRHYGLSLQDVGNAVQAFSTDIPAGTIESAQGDILLRVQEKKYTGDEFAEIVVKTLPDGSALYLNDIAKIDDGFEDVNLESRFNNEPAAFIDIKRSETDDTLEVAATVKEYLTSVALPEGLKLTLQKDETVNLNDRISLMMRNGILGFLLVFLVLLAFLDLKLAFWTSAAIPVSFLGGLMIIYFLGYSMNMITLFALIVVLGIVVDDAIVMGESIFEAQEEDRDNPDAFLKGVKRVIAPVTIGVTTTMAAFAPLIFSSGVIGQIIQIVPIVVIPILFISLMEAYFILPSHLSNSKRWSKGVMRMIRNGIAKKLHAFIEKVIDPSARILVSWRYATLAAFVTFAFITFSMVQSGIIRFIFLPKIEGDEIKVSVEMPVGTPFAVTKKTMLLIEDRIAEIRSEINEEIRQNASGEDGIMDPVKSISISIGQISAFAGPGGATQGEDSSNIGEVIIQLVPSDFRNLTAVQIESRIRKRIENIPNIETLEFQSSLVGGEPDIEVELYHRDEDLLDEASEAFKEMLDEITGVTEVADSYEPGKIEYVFTLTKEGLAVGLDAATLGQQLRAAYFGEEVQRFQRGTSEVIVYVRYPKAQRESLATLYKTRIRLPDGSQVPLSTVANITEQRGYSQIDTVNGQRIISVTGYVDYAVTTPGDVMEQLKNETLPTVLERYQGLSYSFEGESRQQAEDLASLGKNMMIAALLIYVLLGGQLRSYIQPLIIMSAIPFGIVGAIWGHFLLGYDLSFISLFGMVALSGVVVNDSVVLVDYYNNHRNESENTFESLIAAIKRRFRPILLTTLTTSLGLLPILLETSIQAKFLIPMAVSLAMGILFATCVIMVLVPCLIMIIDDIRTLFSNIATAISSLFSDSKKPARKHD